MALLLTESDVGELLTMGDCIRAVEDALRRQGEGRVQNQLRRRLRTPSGVLHCMEAADLGLQRMGLKVYTSYGGGARFLVLLYDTTDGGLLAMIEADRLGQMRTGATTGVATRYMAREDAANLALFGAGWQAETQALAVAAVRPLDRITVFSRTAEKRRAFAERLAGQLDIVVEAAESPEAALEGADIVVTATTSRTPVFDGNRLNPGVHVNAVGSNSLARAEIDATTVARAGRIVVDSIEQARMESGDLLAPYETNRFRWEEARELCQIVSGRWPGRESPEEITLFKSNGLALEDIAAASIVYDRALTEGRGRDVPLWRSGG